MRPEALLTVHSTAPMGCHFQNSRNKARLETRH
jgi:hypothetical protein